MLDPGHCRNSDLAATALRRGIGLCFHAGRYRSRFCGPLDFQQEGALMLYSLPRGLEFCRVFRKPARL